MKYLIIVICIVCSSCIKGGYDNTVFIDSKNEYLEYSGRVNYSNADYSEIYWSGSSVKIYFEGTAVSAILNDDTGANYYNVIIDEDSVTLLRLKAGKIQYELAANLPQGIHCVEIFKRTEYTCGSTKFYGFVISAGGKVIENKLKKERSIEFYGNSITCGYAVEDSTGLDRPDSIYTNNYMSYSAITARNFNANYTCISRSGIGVTISWFPVLITDIYNRLDPNNDAKLWDFSVNKPGIVVINLMQNDSWLINKPDYFTYRYYFKNSTPSVEYVVNSYVNFIKLLRSEYPNTSIICMLGNMDITKVNSEWANVLEDAVKHLNDSNVYTLIVPYKNTPGHPNVAEQQQLANVLIHFINENIHW